MPLPIFVSSFSSPYFAPLFNHWNSSALRLHFVAGRARLCPEDDSLITILNITNHLPDYMASKFRRLQCELYLRASFIYEHDEKHQFDFGFEPAIPGFTLSNKLIDIKYTGKLKKNGCDMVLSEMCVSVRMVMFSLQICIP